MLKKLRIRLVCVNMAIFTVMLSIIFGLVYNFTVNGMEEHSERLLNNILDSRYKQTNRLGRDDELHIPYFTVQMNSWGDAFIIGSSYFDLSDEALVSDLMKQALSTEEDTGIIREYDLRYMRRSTPMGWTVAFLDISGERGIMESFLKSFALIGLISLALFFFISLFLADRTAKPVVKAWTQQQQFVADASHELKTPLTVIMANAELLQDGSYSEAERAHFSESILTMSYKMRQLVERLLDLARADNGQIKTAFAPVEYSTLVSDAVLPFEPVFFERDLPLMSEIEPGLRVNGSAQHLRQAVEILLDNAQKYSQPGEVSLKLARQDRGHCLLSVTNPGELSAAECKDIFKRFYRADKARTGNDSGSYGLGLPIAESIVREHGGKIWAESKNGTVALKILLPTI